MPRPPRPRAAAPHGARRSQRRITAGDPTKMLGRDATQAGSLSSVTIPRPGHAVEPAAGPELLMMMAPGSDLWTSTEKEGRRERGRRRAFACCARATCPGRSPCPRPGGLDHHDHHDHRNPPAHLRIAQRRHPPARLTNRVTSRIGTAR